MTRAEKRKLAREQFDKQITKERAIGVNPIYHNRKWYRYDNVFQEIRNWEKLNKEYNNNG